MFKMHTSTKQYIERYTRRDKCRQYPGARHQFFRTGDKINYELGGERLPILHWRGYGAKKNPRMRERTRGFFKELAN